MKDYERLNHPDSHDATKTLGKVETYQELIIKLQRHLNQRLPGDVEGLTKKQSEINKMFEQNTQEINFLKKIENQEKNYSNLQDYILTSWG